MPCLGRNNYDLRFESAVAIEGERETLADYRGLKLIGRERSLNGSAYYAADFTDEFEVSCEIFSFEHGMWIKMPYEVKSITFCEFARKFFLKYFDHDHANTNWPSSEADYCPLLKGEYWLVKWTPNTDSWVTFMKRGLVKLIYQILKKGKVVGGLQLVANVYERGT
ncbi:uncharacterized protein LOC111518929 [Drosophila willistoni]|uniref:uncharacterized protein LOC111518929 n=1 Tax=Drosophila willistoni TaxID=7260 RepID=UPI000C26D669|nr:uncharacterized protein LOC111518929 [Drosophila willistoni]